jgi:hypothetical protein
MSRLQLVSETYRGGGLAALVGRTLLFGVRRVAWGADACSRRLENALAARMIQREHGAVLARNRTFAGRHAGRRCFILGNGPSLNAHDLSFLAGELTFVCNGFWKHPILQVWQPSYYFLNDPIYFEDEFAEERKRYLADLCAQAGSATFFGPCHARTLVERLSLLPAERTFYVGMVGDLGDGLRTFPPDLTQPIPGVRQVIQMALMAAIYMGCSPIYLLGLDHDWLAHRGADTHFFNGPEFQDKRVEMGLDWWTYGGLMEAVRTMWRAYQSLHAATANGT